MCRCFESLTRNCDDVPVRLYVHIRSLLMQFRLLDLDYASLLIKENFLIAQKLRLRYVMGVCCVRFQ